MRISTTQIYTQGLQAFSDQQTKLAKLQEQISTGTRLTQPSDDPAASARVLELEETVALNEQYQTNISLAQNRLALEETALTGVENVLMRMRELTIQANNATMGPESRRAIAFEIDELHAELVSLANTIDANGDYLFAGFQAETRPFTESTTGSLPHVDFNGDDGERFIDISRSRRINVDTLGKDLFMRMPSATALNEATTSVTATMAPAHVFDVSSFTPGDYQIVITGIPAANSYDVIDVGGVVGPPAGTNTPGQIVASGSYIDSQDIDFAGIRTSITGTPAIGDVFTVSPGQYRSMFEIASNLAETLRSGLDGPQHAAQYAQVLTDIDTAFTATTEARTRIGGRLNALEAQRDDNEALIVATRTTLSSLRDTDLAEAISQLTLEQTTLDAAQAVFARITSSSLFKFLR